MKSLLLLPTFYALFLVPHLGQADNFQPCSKKIRLAEVTQAVCDQRGNLRLFKVMFPHKADQASEVFHFDENEKLTRYLGYSLEGVETQNVEYQVQDDGTYITHYDSRPHIQYEVELFPTFKEKKIQSWHYYKNNRLHFIEDFRKTSAESYPRQVHIYDEFEKLRLKYELDFRTNERNITIVSKFKVRDSKDLLLGEYDESQEAQPVSDGGSYEPVVIIDTGFDLNHKSLKNHFMSEFWGLYDDIAFARQLSKNISDSVVLSVNRQPPFPFSHGTHVASIAMQDIKKMKAVGFAGDFSDVEFLHKISDFIRTKKVSLVNMSFGFGEKGNPFGADDRARYAVLRLMSDNPETLFVIAAGNASQVVSRDMESDWPAGAPVENKIVIAATIDSDFKEIDYENSELASFSNYGDEVDLAAPGDDVMGANIGGTYVAMSGTSMAAPQVMNIAMKMKEINPELTGLQIKKLLLESVIVPKKPLRIKTQGVLSPDRAIKKAIQTRSQK